MKTNSVFCSNLRVKNIMEDNAFFPIKEIAFYMPENNYVAVCEILFSYERCGKLVRKVEAYIFTHSLHLSFVNSDTL